MFNKHHKSIWAGIILILLIVFGSITYYLESQVQLWMKALVEEESLEDAEITADLIMAFSPNFDSESLHAFIVKINKNNDCRITIINSVGELIADSKLTWQEVVNAENYSDKPELLSATNTQPGTTIRYSDIFKQERFYLAKPFVIDGFSGFIRVSHGLSDIAQYTNELRKIQKVIGLMGFILLSLVVMFSYRLLKEYHSLQTKQLEEQVEQKTKSLLEIQKFSQLQAICTSMDELAAYVGKTLPILFPGSSGGLSITTSSSSEQKNQLLAHWGEHWQGHLAFDPVTCWGLRKGAPYISLENTVELKCEHLNISHDLSSICVPLFAENTSIGGLHIIFDHAFSEDVKNQFITIADHLSLAVANMKLRESLRYQAIRDPLTNLYNRRFLDECLRKELLRAARHHNSLAVLMIDIDHFKMFNDSFGHDVGDYVLQKVADVLLKLVRGEDVACRFGGEEFIIVLPDIFQDELSVRANHVLQAVRDLNLIFDDKHIGSISVSIGAATYPEQGVTPQDLISAADTALYKAKKNGRNQVVILQE